MTYLTKNLAFSSNLDGMRALCAEKMFVEKSSSETPLQPHCVRQLPPRGRLYAATAKFPATAKAVPLGKVAASEVSRRKGCSRRAAASAGSRRGSCCLPLRPLLVKMQCRSVRRRSGIALLKIFFPLNMRKANAERIQNRPARSANAYSVSTRSNRSFAASTASLLPKATRTPPESTSDRAAACALSRAASTLHSALRSAVRISSVMPQKYR